MLPMARRIRSRLVQRIYLVGLVQFVIVALAVVALSRQNRPPSPIPDTVAFIARTLESEGRDVESFKAAVGRVHEILHWSLVVYDENGEVLAAAGPPIASWPPASAAASPPPAGTRGMWTRITSRPGGPVAGTVTLALPDGKVGRLVYEHTKVTPAGPLGIGTTAILVLVVVGVSSWLTARSLAVPLARLSATTKAFGSGNLAARVGMKRSDELGDVAEAFDEMADRVTKAIRAERELLANVSHELRTPLQRIRIALDLASEGDADTARESLGEIAEDLGELQRIVDDVLTATRLSLKDGAPQTTAIPPVRRELVNVHTLLDKAAARFRSAQPSRTLDRLIANDLPSLDADPVLLRRVVDNLLENAHKYTEDASIPIVLSACLEGGAVVIEVRDRGIGIAPSDLERVFEPFFRADRSRTRATGGLGLGLALARRIIDAHGGRLSLVSEVGRGTTARVELPRSCEEVAREEVAREAREVAAR